MQMMRETSQSLKGARVEGRARKRLDRRGCPRTTSSQDMVNIVYDHVS